MERTAFRSSSILIKMVTGAVDSDTGKPKWPPKKKKNSCFEEMVFLSSELKPFEGI
jgi:hypothetical protein